ncbi:MAG: hypothetical protein M5T61_02295 [Acidimicrobiia bacterium]|nr:hypothetical protein [Acidimicrobiia bacterium]
MNIAHGDLLQTHRGEPHVVLNPVDAAARGIEDNAPVELFNDVGSCVVPAKLSASVRPGQAIVYNGWEPFQFAGWAGTNDVEPGMVKWLHLAGGYGHLTYAPTGWQPATVDRATRLDARRARSVDRPQYLWSIDARAVGAEQRLGYGRRVSGWACPHEDKGQCRLLRRACDPGIKGCVLHGRVRFAGDSEKNASPEEAERAERRVAKRSRPS